MNLIILILIVTLCSYPSLFKNFSIRNFIENSIAAKKQKIHFVINHKFFNIRRSYYNIWISTIFLFFCFDISKSSWNWKTSWKYSMRTINYIWIFFSLLSRKRQYSTVILTRLISKSLNLFWRIRFSKCLSLINPTSTSDNSFLFIFIIWFMINW